MLMSPPSSPRARTIPIRDGINIDRVTFSWTGKAQGSNIIPCLFPSRLHVQLLQKQLELRTIPIRNGMTIGLASVELSKTQDSNIIPCLLASGLHVQLLQKQLNQVWRHSVSPCEAGHTIGLAFRFSGVFFRASFGNEDVLEENMWYSSKPMSASKIRFTTPLMSSFDYPLYLIGST